MTRPTEPERLFYPYAQDEWSGTVFDRGGWLVWVGRRWSMFGVAVQAIPGGGMAHVGFFVLAVTYRARNEKPPPR